MNLADAHRWADAIRKDAERAAEAARAIGGSDDPGEIREHARTIRRLAGELEHSSEMVRRAVADGNEGREVG